MTNLITTIAGSIKDAPSILKTSDLRTSKVIAYKDQLLKASETMDAEMDKKCNDFIVAAKKAASELNKERKPLTQALREVAKQFTTNENQIKAAINEIQSRRDDWLAAEIKRKEEERLAAQSENLKAGELIQLKADISIDINKQIQTKIDKVKENMRKAMDGVTPDNASDKLDKLKDLNIDIPKMAEIKLTQNVISQYGNNVKGLYSEKLDELYFDLQKHWRTEFQEYKNGCIHLIEKMKNMDADEQKKEIQKAEQKAQVDSASALDVVEAKAEAEKDAAQAELAFNSVATLDEPMPEHRSGWKIEIKSKSAYAAIVAYWFSTIGKTYNHSFENKTIGSMIKDLEKLDERLMIDNVIYKPVYKSVNRAS